MTFHSRQMVYVTALSAFACGCLFAATRATADTSGNGARPSTSPQASSSASATAAQHSPPAASAAPSGSADVAEAERVAYTRARPVFAQYCDSCHSRESLHVDREATRNLTTDSYPFGGRRGAARRDTRFVCRSAKAIGATMPDDHPGSVRGNDLAAVLTWADAFDRAHPPSHRRATAARASAAAHGTHTGSGE